MLDDLKVGSTLKRVLLQELATNFRLAGCWSKGVDTLRERLLHLLLIEQKRLPGFRFVKALAA